MTRKQVFKSPPWAKSIDTFAVGVGLTGVYPFLLLLSVLNRGLFGPLSLYTSLTALITSYGLYKVYRVTKAKWAQFSYALLLALVLVKPAALVLGVAGFIQQLTDTLLIATIGLTLHKLSRQPRLDPLTSYRLDRLGGFIVLSVFFSLIPLPLVSLTALVFSGVLLVSVYTILSKLHYYATRKERVRLKTA